MARKRGTAWVFGLFTAAFVAASAWPASLAGPEVLALAQLWASAAAAVLTIWVGLRLIRDADLESGTAHRTSLERWLPIQGRWLRYLVAVPVTLLTGLFSFGAFTVLFAAGFCVLRELLRMGR